MLQRPLYQTSIAFLSLLALAGGIALVLTQGAPDGVVITQPEALTNVAPGTPPKTSVTVAPMPTGDQLNINSASAAVLESLPEIGPVLAGRIVAYREANGLFRRVDQLMAVGGIGPATFEAIRDLITVGE